jgi:hypothetical protein
VTHRRGRVARPALVRRTPTVPTCPGCLEPYSSSVECSAPVPHGCHWGDEPYWDDHELADAEPLEHCPDCGCQIGQRHHTYCLKAMCSLCEDQALICEHSLDPEDNTP